VVVTILFISTLNFFLFQILPGDPTRVLLPKGGSSGCANQTGNQVGSQCGLRAELLQQWGLNQPLWQRYVIYMRNLVQGNLGTSITVQAGTPVVQIIAPALATTLLLIGLATVVTMWLGLVLGRVSGWRRGKYADVTITMSTLIGYSMPSFFVSLILIYEFAFVVPLFPLPGGTPEINDPLLAFGNELLGFVLPIITFVITNVAWFSLTLRNSLLDVLPEDYMVTAAAKGLTGEQQLRRHALPNARLPVVTASALYFGWVVSGTIIVESVFNINGIGNLTWVATTKQDYPLLSALFLIATLGVVIANAVSDVLYMYLDPRVREA
jgi:peptide/nickel transport system permease protein